MAVKTTKENTRRRAATTPEARESQMISYAINLAEKQLKEGTASSQVITHFLKLGSTRAELENEKLKRENDVLKAKAEAYKQAEHIEELYKDAIEAMKGYSGKLKTSEDEEDDEEN